MRDAGIAAGTRTSRNPRRMTWSACSVISALIVVVTALAARGESPAAFGRRCIPPGCVAPRSNTPGILARRALPAGRIAALDATPDFHHGLLGFGISAVQSPGRGLDVTVREGTSMAIALSPDKRTIILDLQGGSGHCRQPEAPHAALRTNSTTHASRHGHPTARASLSRATATAPGGSGRWLQTDPT